jgi:putative nucleotidyltransferase with HDIG domain
MVEADRVYLPVHPDISLHVCKLMSAETFDIRELRWLVGRDSGLLCNLFRAANSSFFSGLHKTLSIEEAITRLGQKKTRQVLEQACKESVGATKGKLLPHYMPGLWLHSQACAAGARWLSNRCGYQNLADQAYLAGLLHDVGKQFLLAAIEEIAASGQSSMTLSRQLINEVMETMHVEQGVRLFEEWNLPEIYKEVVTDHHELELDTQNIVVTLVRLANLGCRKLGLGLEKCQELVLPTTAEAQFLGIDEISLAEFEIALEDQFLGGKTAAVSQ